MRNAAATLGLIAGLIVLGLFLALAWHGLRVARLAIDDRGYLIAFGVSFMIAFQAAINLSVVTDLVPPKGISLPFISYGGSGLLSLAVGIGLVVSVARGSARDASEIENEMLDEQSAGEHETRESGDGALVGIGLARN